MAGIQFTAGEHGGSSCFISSGKAGPVVRIRVAEPASDTGTVGKVMQLIAFLHQTGAETGHHGAGSPTRGGCCRDALSRAVCLTR